MNKHLRKILSGIGSVLVIAPSTQAVQLNRDDYLAPSDADAIRSAWIAVGNDIRKAASQIDAVEE